VTGQPRKEPLAPGEEVTQFGRQASGFKNRPIDAGRSLSAVRGRVNLATVVGLVIKSRPPIAGDGCRYARVDALLTRGFTVSATPSTLNSLHVSIEYSGDWDDTVVEAFEECFGTPVFHV
jgi:hypothetical protein